MKYIYYFAARDYTSDAYGSGVYGDSTTEVTSPTPTTDTSGPLANTGYDVIVPAALALAIIGASGVMLVKKLRRRGQ